jgi:type VI secretion system protein
MENYSLYDLLVGSFIHRGDDPSDVDEKYFERFSEDQKIRQSIIENLKMVLTTRQGSVQHLPDFGIPDIKQIYFDEGTLESVPKRIFETSRKYEPRLTNIRVKKKDFDEKNLRITLEISAEIKESTGKEVLLTEFSSTGWTKVVFERDQK